MWKYALLLTILSSLLTGLVALTHEWTRERVRASERQHHLKVLKALLPEQSYDNDPLDDVIRITAPEWFGSRKPVRVYRLRRQGEPVAAVLEAVPPDGYNGPIRLLIAIRVDGTLAGVRVVSHRETPGLGDRIDVSRSSWIQSFRGRSLDDPGPDGWAVKKDGGAFDQFTGATITPRAVVRAVRRALIYFQKHRAELFAR